MFSGDLLRNYKKFLYASIIPMLKANGQLISYLYEGEIKGFTKDEVKNVLKYHF